jgi:4-hydroxybenzoate polyprenyltransferase
VALGLAPLGSWLAVKGGLDLWPIRESAVLPLLLAGAVVFWLIGFDVIYALQDYDFDRQHRLHSLVVRWGPDNALKASFLAHILMWGLLALFGLLSRFRIPYSVGLAVILASLLFEHWLARRRSRRWIQTAFFRLNALISLVFLIAVITEVVFPGFRIRR